MAIIGTLPVSCGTCGASWDAPLGVRLQTNLGDSVTFAAGSVVASCPACGLRLANTGATTGNVTNDGLRLPVTQLRAVIKDLARRDFAELRQLRADLERARAQRDAVVTQELLQRNGLGGWFSSQDNRLELWMVLALVAACLQLVLGLRSGGPPPTPEEVDKIVVNVTLQIQSEQLIVPPTDKRKSPE